MAVEVHAVDALWRLIPAVPHGAADEEPDGDSRHPPNRPATPDSQEALSPLRALSCRGYGGAMEKPPKEKPWAILGISRREYA